MLIGTKTAIVVAGAAAAIFSDASFFISPLFHIDKRDLLSLSFIIHICRACAFADASSQCSSLVGSILNPPHQNNVAFSRFHVHR